MMPILDPDFTNILNGIVVYEVRIEDDQLFVIVDRDFKLPSAYRVTVTRVSLVPPKLAYNYECAFSHISTVTPDYLELCLKVLSKSDFTDGLKYTKKGIPYIIDDDQIFLKRGVRQYIPLAREDLLGMLEDLVRGE